MLSKAGRMCTTYRPSAMFFSSMAPFLQFPLNIGRPCMSNTSTLESFAAVPITNNVRPAMCMEMLFGIANILMASLVSLTVVSRTVVSLTVVSFTVVSFAVVSGGFRIESGYGVLTSEAGVNDVSGEALVKSLEKHLLDCPNCLRITFGGAFEDECTDVNVRIHKASANGRGNDKHPLLRLRA